MATTADKTADKATTTPDVGTAPAEAPNAPKDFKNLSEDEAKAAAAKGESVTTFGYDGAHMSSNTPIQTTGGVQGYDPLRYEIEDLNSPFPTMRVQGKEEKGDKTPSAPEGTPKNTNPDAVGEARALHNKWQHESNKRTVMLPADKDKGNYQGSINGAKFEVPRGVWVDLTDDQIHNIVASGEMPPPSREFQSSQNPLSPEMLLIKQRNELRKNGG